MEPDQECLTRSVLIVDDNETDRYLLRRLLKKSGVTTEVHEQLNGRAALDFLSDFEGPQGVGPDSVPLLIFLDVNMPVMGGFAFLDELDQRYGGAPEARVLMMLSPGADPKEEERAVAYDFVRGCVYKMPKSAGELRERVAALV